MTETRWWKYLQRLMGDQSQLDAAKFIGISKSNITRWKDGTRAAPDFVVKVARAYDANVLEALVAAEFITEAEAKLREIKIGGITLSDASNQQLLDEIMRRLTPEANRLSGDPTGENIDYQQRDDLAKRRQTSPNLPADSYDDGTVREFDYSPDEYAADSSPDENEERIRRGEDPID